jgi:hypothetical protein
MRFGAVAILGMIAGVGVQAQQAPQGAHFVVVERGCPGALRAQHQATSGYAMWTVALEDKDRDGQAQKARGPGLHVEFDGVKDKVKALELSVSYLPVGSRVLPVEPGMDSKSAKESKKTFVLQQEAARQVDAELLVGPAATITRVHLVSATFADGSVWRASSEDVCSVAPALYMAVEAKK